MIKCKVEGCEEELKDARGLSAHVRGKHEMSLKEYKAKYEEASQEESKETVQPLTGVDPDEASSEPKQGSESLQEATEKLRETFKFPPGDEQILEPLPSEEIPATEQEQLDIVIVDYTLLPPELTMSAMFVDEEGVIRAFKKALAIGTVQIDEVSMASVLVVSDDGMLIPPSVLQGFSGMVETKFESAPKKHVKKGFFRRKKKTEERPTQNINPEDLIREFSKFLKTTKK